MLKRQKKHVAEMASGLIYYKTKTKKTKPHLTLSHETVKRFPELASTVGADLNTEYGVYNEQQLPD